MFFTSNFDSKLQLTYVPEVLIQESNTQTAISQFLSGRE